MNDSKPFASRQVRAGDRFALRKGPVTTRQLVMYAGASGDFNRIHYDQAFAIEAGLGGVIAHGMLTMGFAGQCVTDWAGPGTFVGEIGGRFIKPVRPGDFVDFELVVEAVDTAAGECSVTLAAAVGEDKVFSGSAKVRPAGDRAR
jgi:acyl dehydratase